MKNIAFALIIFLSACQTEKKVTSENSETENIMYVFPTEVISLFENKLGDSVYFCLYSEPEYYDLYISSAVNKYSRVTNRKLFIKGKSYPLIFDLDMWFGTTTPEKELIRQFNNNEYLETTSSVTIHEGFYVRFNRKGDVITSGYGLEKQK